MMSPIRMTENSSPPFVENPPPHPSVTPGEIAEEIADSASWLAGGGLSPEDFIRTVTTLEARKLARFSLSLSSAVSGKNLVHFNVRHIANGELCASMDVDIESGVVSIQACD